MVDLPVVDDNEVDVLEPDFLLQIVPELFLVRLPDRIDEDGFLLLDQIGVLTRTMIDRVVVTMEGLEFPINPSNPGDIVLDSPFHASTPFHREIYTVCSRATMI